MFRLVFFPKAGRLLQGVLLKVLLGITTRVLGLRFRKGLATVRDTITVSIKCYSYKCCFDGSKGY